MEEASPPWRTTSQTRSGSISPIFCCCCCYLCFAPYDVDHRCVRHRTAPRPFFRPQWTQPVQARQQAISSSDVRRLCCVIVYVCVLTALGEKSNQEDFPLVVKTSFVEEQLPFIHNYTVVYKMEPNPHQHNRIFSPRLSARLMGNRFPFPFHTTFFYFFCQFPH